MRAFGKYRLIEPLASGGMADVWRAEVALAEGVVKEVALKLVRGEHAARSDFVRMFIAEARLASRLSHANVVQVFEFDQVDGRYYLAMELVRGGHLGRVVERARELGLRLGLPRAVHVAAEAARGLAHAHRLAEGGRPLGVVHRDVSPHNVLLSFEGEVKVADFGIARAMSEAGLTEPGTLKGKVAYMAPEQARGGRVDARADVFSLGVVLWELCTGRRLFARETEAATFGAVMAADPISPPSAWNEEVPPELDAVVAATLERDPERRTASAQELATALDGVLLHIARSPDDWDLRVFMHRLWPEGATPAPSPGSEPTRVRPAPDAGAALEAERAALEASPPAEAGAGAPGGAGEGGAGLAGAAPAGPAAEQTAPTRTALGGRARTARGARWPATIGVAAVLGAAAAVGLARGRAQPRPTVAEPHPLPGLAVPAVAGAASPVLGGAAQPPAPVQAARTEAAPVPAATPDPAPAGGRAPGEPRVAAPEAGALPGPAAPRADAVTPPGASPRAPAAPGQLAVNALPWAYVTVDGKALGETPVNVSLPAGRHRVRATHPSYGTVETVVEIAPGRRTTWNAALRGR